MAPQLRWTDEMDQKLAEILVREVGARAAQFKKDRYQQIMQEIQPLCPQPLTVKHVQTHIKHIKSKYQLARRAVTSSGFGIQWDADNKYLTVDPITWAEYCKGRDVQLKGMLHKAFPLYDAFFHVFGDDCSTGHGAMADGDETEEEATPATPIELTDDFCEFEDANMPQAAQTAGQTPGGSRKRRNRGSSSRTTVDAMNRVAAAMESMTGCFVERNKQLAATNKDEVVGTILRELVELGLDEKYESLVATMIASCPAYERALIFHKKEKRVQYVMSLLEKEGVLEDY